jgi:hypothetical protein
MGLLDKLTKDGSLLTALDGKKPLEYDKVSNYPEGLKKSQLDLDGKKPLEYDKVSNYQEQLTKSQLDLDGKNPNKYLDNPPR